jgi:transposase
VLSVAPAVRVFVAADPVDMRGSFDALAGAVRRLGLDPLAGDLFLFLNRRRTLARILWFDRSGWCLYSKRLESGTFDLPVVPEGARRVGIDGATLAALLEGIDLRAPRRRWYRRDAVGIG